MWSPTQDQMNEFSTTPYSLARSPETAKPPVKKPPVKKGGGSQLMSALSNIQNRGTQ